MTLKTDLFLLDKNPSQKGSINYWMITPIADQCNDYEIVVPAPNSTAFMKEICSHATGDYAFIQVKPGRIEISEVEINDWFVEACEADADLCYSGCFEIRQGEKQPHPVIAYSLGSIRDDFDFGALVMIKNSLLRDYLADQPTDYQYAGWYDFRLFISRKGKIKRSGNFFYTFHEPDQRVSGTKQFDYVNPMNRERQIEMEKAATHHLDLIGAKVLPPFMKVDFRFDHFEVEATVIIPVLNREMTIADAIRSVVTQKTTFPFNLIIIDNHSTDRTSEIIDSFNDDRIIHLVPERKDLGIGGCWNEGVRHAQCGRFAVQLDSDDLYKDETTLQQVVDKFHAEHCAMVIGSYLMVNYNLETIPPGIIDHKEWTDNNGPNNALRINGLGAPRAFFTPIVRKIGFPNVSYGEDYAVALTISRNWKVGRIYEPIYLCRRWDNNTDSNLGIEKINEHNLYKDALRKAEIEARLLYSKVL